MKCDERVTARIFLKREHSFRQTFVNYTETNDIKDPRLEEKSCMHSY